MGKAKTKNQKKARVNAAHVAQEDYGTVPHSFVFHRGQVGKNVAQLVQDMRRVMEPFTAESLKVRKKNVLKDFVAVAGPLGVTHFLVFTKTPSSINMRLARLPKGPMLHFRVLKYSLVKDVVSSLKKHRMHQHQFSHHPLLVLNNFGVEGLQVKLMATMFQNMFPSINVHKVNLNTIRRCVLINYDPLSQEVDFRHYSVKVVPVGMSRGVKKLMQERFPNMSKLEDISELLLKGANLSESEAEQDGEHNITELPQVYSGRGNMRSQQSAVRLTEIGPRMTLQLVKIEEGMGEGSVLYHAVISKTEEELQEILNRKEAELKRKEERRKKQQQDVAQKKEKREENRKKSLEGIKKKLDGQAGGTDESEVEDPGMQEDRPANESEDEAEYYRQAVGEEPDEDMFSASKRKRGASRPPRPYKKRKLSSEKGPAQDGASKPGKNGKRGPRPGGLAEGRGGDRLPHWKGGKKILGKMVREGGPKWKGQKGKPQAGARRKGPGKPWAGASRKGPGKPQAGASRKGPGKPRAGASRKGPGKPQAGASRKGPGKRRP